MRPVSDGFARVLKVVERLSRRSPGHVTLFTTAAFSYGWVLPRLRGFSALHPDIDLRIQVISRQLHYDPDDDSFLELRVGDGLWEGYESALLFPEEVFPVASPGYVDGMEHPHDPRALANERLIHEDVAFLPTIPAVTWSDWFAAFGIDYRDEGTGLRTSEYMLALQAAIGGEGVVLGWAHLVDRLLEQGLLGAGRGPALAHRAQVVSGVAFAGSSLSPCRTRQGLDGRGRGGSEDWGGDALLETTP